MKVVFTKAYLQKPCANEKPRVFKGFSYHVLLVSSQQSKKHVLPTIISSDSLTIMMSASPLSSCVREKSFTSSASAKRSAWSRINWTAGISTLSTLPLIAARIVIPINALPTSTLQTVVNKRRISSDGEISFLISPPDCKAIFK